MGIPISIRLAIRQWRARPLRPVLCSLAIAAAVALIICVGAAMDSLKSSLTAAIGRALGVAQAHVRPAQRDTDARVNEAMLTRVRALPEVDFAGGRLLSKGVLKKDMDRWFDVVGIMEPLDAKLRPKVFVSGRELQEGPAGANEMLIDESVAEAMSLKLGDEIDYRTNDQPARKMKVVGILERPRLEILARPTIFVSYEQLTKDMGIGHELNVIDVKLKDSAGIEDYDEYAKKLNEKLGKSVEVAPGTTSKAQLSDLTRMLRLFLVVLSVMSAFCASLIIGTTLSVGVQERVRQFGQLRCIGASRGQLAVFLLGDAVVLLVIGMGIGSVMGVLLSMGLVKWFPMFFGTYELSVVTLITAAGCGAFATALGALIPIWQVMKVPPMAAVTSVAKVASRPHVWMAAAGGIACLLVQILMWNGFGSRDWRFFSYAFVGIPLIFSGWCLLAPAAVILLERTGAVLLGAIFGVRSSLLRNAWSRTPWRAGAMIAALMIGVTMFTTVRARGKSLVESWKPLEHMPDLIVKKILGGGLNEARLAMLKKEHPEMKDVVLFDYFGVQTTGTLTGLSKLLNENDTTFIAVQPREFLRMVDMEYVEGDPATALKQLEEGRHVFVTKEFRAVRHMGLGDKLTFRGADGKEAQYTIAAVVGSTGVEVVKNYFDLRASFSEKAISSVLGTIADARKDFKLGDPTMFLANLRDASGRTPTGKAMAALRSSLDSDGLASLSSIEIKDMLRGMIERVMNGLSVIGIGALCVASLGVANMVIASVHARRYEFGVLRAIGAGRGQVVRLVLAEVTLIGVIAGVLGAAAGLWFAFMATQLDWVLMGFPTHFLSENVGVAIGYALALAGVAILLTTVLAWLASLGPAIRGAVTAQRTLLAGGRG